MQDKAVCVHEKKNIRSVMKMYTLIAYADEKALKLEELKSGNNA